MSTLRTHSEEGSGTGSAVGGIPVSEGHDEGCGRAHGPEARSGQHTRGSVPIGTQSPAEGLQEAPNGDSAGVEASPLDKLGKPRQGGVEGSCDEPQRSGGLDPDEAKETLRKRARSKWITMGLLEELESLESPVPYEKARGCCNVIEQRDGELTAKYCRSRWCLTCNRIRAGVRINRYVPVFEDWDRNGGVQFVTLTVPNCEGENLGDTLDEMRDQLKLCRRQIRRTRGLEYKAVRSTEVTYNEEAGTYHPHFHIAVCGRSAAIALRDEWLKRWPQATREAQDVTEWDGDPGSLKELVKYPTKLMTTAEGEGQPNPEALDLIFRVLKGRHLFQPVGFKISDYNDDLDPTVDLDEFEDIESTIPAFSRPGDKVLWVWDEAVGDWVDEETGECLTQWDPTLLDRAAARGDPGRRPRSDNNP